MEIEDIFLRTVDKYKLIKRKDKVILGVSGGPDSICMLHLFSRIKDEFKLDLVCAHFNHSLREEADEDEEFVRDVCRNLKIKFVSEKRDVRKFFQGDSLEQVARNLRFDFFFKCARELKIKKVALGHNKDDVVETTLMRIIRGTALRGLGSILPALQIRNVTFIRPLLQIGKESILNWLRSKKIHYRIDKTNFEEKFFRNRIRTRLLPILQEFNPNVVNTIFNLSRTAALDYDFLYSISLDKFNQLKKQKGKGYIKLRLEQLKKMHPAIIFSILRIAIEEVKGNTRRLELKHLESVLDLISGKSLLGSVDLPDLLVKKEEDWLTIKSLLF